MKNVFIKKGAFLNVLLLLAFAATGSALAQSFDAVSPASARFLLDTRSATTASAIVPLDVRYEGGLGRVVVAPFNIVQGDTPMSQPSSGEPALVCNGFTVDPPTYEVVHSQVMKAGSGTRRSVIVPMVFDGSGSVSGNDPDRLRVGAGETFVGQLQSGDVAGVFEFGPGEDSGFGHTRRLADFTGDSATLSRAVERVTASGGSPMYDSLREVAAYTREHLSFPGRDPFLLLFSDGGPGNYDAKQGALAVLRQLGAPVTAVGLGEASANNPNADADAVQVMQELADQTGGFYIGLTDALHAEAVFQQIGSALLNAQALIELELLPALGAGETATVTIHTNIGDITVELRGGQGDTALNMAPTYGRFFENAEGHADTLLLSAEGIGGRCIVDVSITGDERVVLAGNGLREISLILDVPPGFALNVPLAAVDNSGKEGDGTATVHTTVRDHPELTAQVAVTVFDDEVLQLKLNGPADGTRVNESLTFSAEALNIPHPEDVVVEWDLDADGEFDDGTGLSATTTFSACGSYPIAAKAVLGDESVVVRRMFYVAASPVDANEPVLTALVRPPEELASDGLRDAENPSLPFVFDGQKTDDGLVVITHGLASTTEAVWMTPLAEAIRERLAAGENPRTPNIALYGWRDDADPANVAGLPLSPKTRDGWIQNLLAIQRFGYSHGYILADWIAYQADAGEIDLAQPVHLIGHSAGGFVVGQAAALLRERLLNVQVTLLDTPFPNCDLVETVAEAGGRVDTYCSIFGHSLESGVAAMRSVHVSQVYPNPPGTWDAKWSNLEARWWRTGFLDSHAYPPHWYRRSADEDSDLAGVDDDSLEGRNYRGAATDGFNQSIWFESTGDPRETRGAARDDGVVRVDLSADTFTLFGDTAVDAATIVATERPGSPGTNAGAYRQLTVPATATNLVLKYRFTAPGDGDMLSIFLGDELLFVGPDVALTRSDDADVNVSLPEHFRGGDHRLLVRLDSRNDVNATVTIRDVGFLTVAGLRVTLEPQQVVSEGAGWSLDTGETWHASGTVAEGIAPGEVTVDFPTFVGWESPDPLQATIVAGKIAEHTVAYSRKSYSCRYESGPNGTISGAAETTQTIPHGENGAPVTAEPGAGYRFVQWSDGRADNPRTDSEVTAEIAVVAEFAAKLSQTLTCDLLLPRVYGDAPFTLDAAASSGLPAVVTSSEEEVATIGLDNETWEVTIRGAGETELTVAQDGNENWKEAPAIQRTLTVARAPLVCAVDDIIKKTGEALPPLTVIYSGLKGGDTAPENEPAVTCAAGAASPVGIYPITLSGGPDPNYALDLRDGAVLIYEEQYTEFRLWLSRGTEPPAVLLFGVTDAARNDFDPGWDEAVPGGTRATPLAYFVNPFVVDPDMSLLTHDFRRPAHTTRWRLHMPGSSAREAVDLTWDVGAAEAEREIYLQEIEGEQAVGFPVDMRTQNEPLVVEGEAEFELVYAPRMETTLPVRPGWNLLGNPAMSTQRTEEIFTTDRRTGLILAPVWTFRNGKYRTCGEDDPLYPEVGYWVYGTAEDASAEISGVQADGTIMLNPGWNLISPAADVMPPESRGDSSRIWRWDNEEGGYVVVGGGEMMRAGCGYWVYLSGNEPTRIQVGE